MTFYLYLIRNIYSCIHRNVAQWLTVLSSLYTRFEKNLDSYIVNTSFYPLVTPELAATTLSLLGGPHVYTAADSLKGRKALQFFVR